MSLDLVDMVSHCLPCSSRSSNSSPSKLLSDKAVASLFITIPNPSTDTLVCLLSYQLINGYKKRKEKLLQGTVKEEHEYKADKPGLVQVTTK